MSATLDDLYLEWLYSQVAQVNASDPHETYWSLLRDLYSKEFVWFVPNDDNRVEDGRDLRDEFGQTNRVGIDSDWRHLGCSCLELLIGLSRRLSFEAEGEPSRWFWEMLDNLGLSELSDYNYARSPGARREVDLVLDGLIWRTYKPNGSGGLFPLKHFNHDQRNVELWYQMNAYLLEN